MLRRSPETILVAHRMDPGRRDLYVEGVRDSAFLHWLVGDNLRLKSAAIAICFVDMPAVEEGGNRERLKRFLIKVESEGYDIRGLLDADQGRLIGEDIPSNAWCTDLRDAESYVLEIENIDAALRLGFGIQSVSAESVANSAFNVAHFLAAARLASHKLGLKLPISKSRLSRYVRCTRAGVLILDESGYLSAMLQSAGVGLTRLEAVTEAVSAAQIELKSIPIREVIHGKDYMKLLTIQFKALGASNVQDVAPLMWSSFKREKLTDYPILQEVVEYLT